MVHRFDNSNDFSEERVQEFLKRFPVPLRETGGYAHDEDFRTAGGQTLELKSEKYPSGRNLFFERYSHEAVPGGPYRAAQHGIDLYVHFMIDGVSYIFDPEELVARLDVIQRGVPLKSIHNETHVSRGWAVPVRDVADLLLKIR